MQRKNDLLRPMKRNAIAMIMAVAVLVVLGIIMAFSIQMTTKTAKRAVDIYVEDQANLYGKNVAEYVVYKISQEKNCTRGIPTSFDIDNGNGLYHADLNLTYMVSDDNASSYCNQVSDVNLSIDPDNGNYAYVRIDVTLRVDDGNVTTEPITIFRRYVEDITPFVYINY